MSRVFSQEYNAMCVRSELKRVYISLLCCYEEEKKVLSNRFEFIFEFFEKRTRFEIPRQLVFLDGRKKEDDDFSGQTRAKKSAEKSKPKGR